MTDSVFWIWMQKALGIGNIKADLVRQQIGSPETLYNMSGDELLKTGLFASKEVTKIKSASLEDAQFAAQKAESLGYQIITPDSPLFPYNLTNIDASPCVLYVQGDLEGLSDELVITLIGTRKSSEYGRNAAAKLSYDLASAGCTVVSGLAVGIDYACHEGALQAKGRTIGVLACGIDVDYPAQSHDLKKRILDEGGALISEFPLGERALRQNFYIRNRLLSGIASGVVVVQAPQQSGALVTARHALEQNRDVFAVPGEIFDPMMVGCNRLIKDGCKIVTNVYSILEEYIGRFPARIDPRQVVPKIRQAQGLLSVEASGAWPRKAVRILPDGTRETLRFDPPQEMASSPEHVIRLSPEQLVRLQLSEPAKAVYALLDHAAPMDCDTLSEKAQRSVSEILGAMTELELFGLARSLPGKRYLLSNASI